MIVAFIHNPFDGGSTQILREARRRFARLEVYDFQALRGLRHVQGAPAVWLFYDGQDPLADEPAWQQNLQVDLKEVDRAIAELRQ